MRHAAFIASCGVRRLLTNDETIERYPADQPYPSSLALGWIDQRALHIVVADNAAANTTIVIMVYEPDPARWDATLRKRAQSSSV